MSYKIHRLVVASSGTVSTTGGDNNDGIFYLDGRRRIGIVIPTIDSSTVGIQVSNDPDASSPTYSALQKADGSAALATTAGIGGVSWTIDMDIPFRAFKIVCGSAQTGGARTFIVSAL